MLQLRKAEATDKGRWDEFVENAVNGTFFHELGFLDYHGDRFNEQVHHLLWEKGPHIFAVFPMAIFNTENGRVAKSPFGASWGGLVYKDGFSVKNAILIVEGLLTYLRENNIDEVIITPPPFPYHKYYNGAFEFALMTRGFQLVNRDIIHTVDLSRSDLAMDILDSKCRNQARKGAQHFSIQKNVKAEEVYAIFKADKERLNATMTHSLEELLFLSGSKSRVTFDMAINTENSSKAAVCYFHCNSNALLTFYISQEEGAKGKNGLNYLLAEGMISAKSGGIKYFDFGTSSMGGNINNIGISEFKESFGAGCFFRDTYKLSFR